MSDVTDAPARAQQDACSSGHGSPVWYELMTPDPAGAKAFYDAVVGWNFGEGSPEFNGYRLIGRSDGGSAGGVLPLTGEMQQHGARPAWLGYIGVDDVDSTVAAIGRSGGKALMPPFDIPGIGRIALMTDPAGAPFYVMKPVPSEGREGQQSDIFSVDQPQHVRWNELSTTDPDGAIAFYREQFGWGQDGEMDMGEYGQYRFIQNGGVSIGAIMPKMPEMPVSAWTYYIGVDDIDRATEAVRAGGGTVTHGPQEIPGGEFAVNGIDPHGAAFGLVGPRKQGGFQ